MTLEQQVRDFYDEQRLSDAEVDAILAVKPVKKPRGRWAILAGASGLTAAAAAILLVVCPKESVVSPVTVGNPPPLVEPNAPALIASPPMDPSGYGKISVVTRPPGASVRIDGMVRGVTPMIVNHLEVGSHKVEVRGKHNTKKLRVVVSGGPDPLKLMIDLNAAVDENYEESPAGSCNGPPTTISVMPIGQPDCKVQVGSAELGLAPFFKKTAPSGLCEIRVTCPNGKSWLGRKRLRAGEDTKVIIKPGNWEGASEPIVSSTEAAEVRAVPTSAKELYNQGTSELKGGRLQSAIDLFTRCVETDPTFVLCYRALGITFARAGNGPKSYRWYSEYVRVAPHARDADDVRRLMRDYEEWRDKR